MSFTKNDLEIIKSKIQLSREIEKKVKVKKKVMTTGVVALSMKKKLHPVKLMMI